MTKQPDYSKCNVAWQGPKVSSFALGSAQGHGTKVPRTCARGRVGDWDFIPFRAEADICIMEPWSQTETEVLKLMDVTLKENNL